jgi:hypothetical protein
VTRVVADETTTGSHHGDPGSLLGLVGLIGGPVPEAFVVSVPVTDLGFGPDLTAACRALVPVAVDAVIDVATRPLARPVSLR